MKKLLFLVSLLLFVSCDTPLDQSVFKHLSTEDLNKAIKKDPSFADVYQYVEAIRNSKPIDDIGKAKFYDITYRDMEDYFKFKNDTSFFALKEKEWKLEWKNKYENYQTKVDSIIIHWWNYEQKNGMGSYVKIKLDDIKSENYSNGDVKNINLGFKITSLKGEIDHILFKYYIEELGENSYVSESDKYECTVSKPFVNSITEYWTVNYRDKRLLTDAKLMEYNRFITSSDRIYNVYVEIDEVTSKGERIRSRDVKIPRSVQSYLKYNSSIYKDMIITECLDKDYLPEKSYVYKKRKELMSQKYPLIEEFVETQLQK